MRSISSHDRPWPGHRHENHALTTRCACRPPGNQHTPGVAAPSDGRIGQALVTVAPGHRGP